VRLGVDIDLGGHPDLQGVWDFRTATPLERPPEFAQREFLSDEDVAAVERRAAERLRVDGTGDQLCIGVAIVALSSCTDSRPVAGIRNRITSRCTTEARLPLTTRETSSC